MFSRLKISKNAYKKQQVLNKPIIKSKITRQTRPMRSDFFIGLIERINIVCAFSFSLLVYHIRTIMWYNNRFQEESR